MENQSLNIEQLLGKLTPGTLMLSPNSRLRRRLLQHYSDSHSSGLVHSSPEIYSQAQWCEESWLQLQDQAWPQADAIVINASQRLQLWQQIILENEESKALICPELLAKQADSAWRSLEQWQLPQSVLTEYSDNEALLLEQWGSGFRQRCETLGFISQEQRLERIILAFDAGELKPYEKILLVGFDDIPPLNLALFNAAGRSIENIQLRHQQGNQVRSLACDDAEAELRACAKWARGLLSQEQSEPGRPNKKLLQIGIIDPQLGQRRDAIERIFTEELEPQFLQALSPRYTLPFNFSAGTPLALCPIIHTALSLLRCNHSKVDCEAFCQLLHSPFWHDNHDLANELSMAERSQLEHRLRQLQQEKLRTAQLRRSAEKVHERLKDNIEKTEGYKSLSQRLSDIQYSVEHQSGKKTARFWSQLFFSQLQMLGWPGQRRLDSNEYQQVSQFYALLENLSGLDNCKQTLSLGQALTELGNLAHSHHYQAKTPTSPILILGALEGAGLDFDHCWVLSMQQKNWPPSPQPNPLLPVELQREHSMPHASVERELQFAQALTDSYCGCAGEVIFSYPRNEGDEELQASPLIRGLEQLPTSEPFEHPAMNAGQSLDDYRQALIASQDLSWVDNSKGPAINLAESRYGGSGVLKQQALCPFNAFAHYRLAARAWPQHQIGLSPIERGNIVHLCLENIWRQLGSQEALLRLDEEALEQEITQQLKTAIDSVLAHRFDLGQGFRSIELQRLLPIMSDWLTQEKERPPFTVEGVELERDFAIGPLNLSLRMDRLDRIVPPTTSPVDIEKNSSQQDGDEQKSLLIIDYKTGQCQLKSWMGARPEEPQLPLYSLCEDSINSIAFAQLNASQTGFVGLTASQSPGPGIKSCEDEKVLAQLKKLDHRHTLSEEYGQENWQSIKAQWREDLECLATAYAQGDASLDFKDPLAERYSEDLQALQRSNELQQRRQRWLQHAPAQASLAFEF